MGSALPNVWINKMVTGVVLLVGLGRKDEEDQVNSPCHFLGASISISDFNVLLVSHLPEVSWQFAQQRRWQKQFSIVALAVYLRLDTGVAEVKDMGSIWIQFTGWNSFQNKTCRVLCLCLLLPSCRSCCKTAKWSSSRAWWHPRWFCDPGYPLRGFFPAFRESESQVPTWEWLPQWTPFSFSFCPLVLSMDRGVSQRPTECLVFVACSCLVSHRTPFWLWSCPQGTHHSLAKFVDLCREVPTFTEVVQSVQS